MEIKDIAGFERLPEPTPGPETRNLQEAREYLQDTLDRNEPSTVEEVAAWAAVEKARDAVDHAIGLWRRLEA